MFIIIFNLLTIKTWGGSCYASEEVDSIDYGSISFSESGPHQQSRGMAFVDMAVFANIAVFRIAFPPIINFKRLRAGARCIFFPTSECSATFGEAPLCIAIIINPNQG